MKRALHIGLNYAGSPYALPDCHLDAQAMEARASVAGFSTEIKGGVYSIDNFLADYERLRSKAKKSDTTLISYSGHGTQWNSRAESDGYEEGLCFWNGKNIEVLPDDDFKLLMEKIPGRVIVVLDSCFSGGMSRLAKPTPQAGIGLRRFIPFQPDFEIYRPPQARDLPRAVNAIGNKIYYLFACQEQEVSYSTGHGGLFTRFFCDNYDATAKSKRTIKTLMFQTLKNCAPDQHPKFEGYGTSASKLIF